jgi:2-(1,2-epoxy-1,2-dihydrophenyl)acetyl-CoA isomerase
VADELHVEIQDGVMLVTIDRPEAMNALSDAVSSGLLDAVDRANREDDVRAVVLTGVGRAFCAGAEISADRDPARRQGDTPPRAQRMDWMSRSGRTVEAFRHCDVPIIAAVNGAAAGAGFGIALCCDVRFAAESARLGPIFIKRGLSTDFGVAYWLPRIVGQARAFEIIYEGDLLDSARALEAGLVNRVYPDDRLLDETLAFAGRIAQGPPLAYTAVRRLLHHSVDTGMRAFLEQEWTAQATLLRTADAAEGFAAFREKRKPEFHGV